ncbi:hypothetical protein [Streptomyces venezuelae]|uniref:hypothetical protein n=1 Tax=Streptomyces venezuelae TaxID=54571 RepID=UPI003799B7E7
MPSITGTHAVRARRSTIAVAAATATLTAVAVTGCGSGNDDANAKERRTAVGPEQTDASTSAASPGASKPGSAGARTRAAELVEKAIDVTLEQDFLRSTRRTRTEGTTVMHSAVRGEASTCETSARKGAATLDWVITPSALYTRGSEGALRMAPEAQKDPARVKVMADRWIKRDANIYEVMRDMCGSKNRRDWLRERLPSMNDLRKASPEQRSVTLHGQPATKVTYQWEGGPVEFHIAAEGTPFLLRAAYAAKDLDESYDGIGKPFRVAAPSGAVTDVEMAREVHYVPDNTPDRRSS